MRVVDGGSGSIGSSSNSGRLQKMVVDSRRWCQMMVDGDIWWLMVVDGR